MSRRVWFLVPGDLDTPTGGYGYDRRMIAGLAALGWQVEPRRLEDEFPFPNTAALAQAARVLGDIPDAESVVVDGLAFGALPDLAEAEGSRLRLLALVHHPLAEETGLDAAEAERLRAAEARALGHARGVLVTSAFTAHRLADYKVPAECIGIVEPGVERRGRARGTAGGPLQLLCVGAVTPRKGHDVLLHALAGVVDGDWRVACVGSLDRTPDWAAAMQRLADHLGLAGRVRFTGALPPADLEQCYLAADLAVLATRFEGYGMAIAEALAYGLPVVCTRGGAVADTLPADAGVSVPVDDDLALRDALGRLLTDSNLRHAFAEGAWRAAQGLPDWSEAARRFAEAITRLAERPPPAPAGRSPP